ncbi:hypothetical protein P692DRAFT_20752255 [Suillus brevipes Sb2]|nr:hypothetical protein P692DRAFT_20752255 [Suillus brevipes Sb2]
MYSSATGACRSRTRPGYLDSKRSDCLGWNYLFQAHKEQILWRVVSVGLACSPLIGTTMLALIAILHLGSRGDRDRYETVLLRTVYVSICLYVFSRITTFVLMFLSLRSLPPGAYDTVAWTEFIPHVNL